jgi:hypothetical protein
MEVRITKVRVAMAALFVLAGVGLASLLSPLVGTALATIGQTVNISDHSASAYFAKVSSDGKLSVGDGAGPLSVDGTVMDRPAAPASPWHWSGEADSGSASDGFIAGPSASPINITSLSLSTNSPSGDGLAVVLWGYHVPKNATDCSAAFADTTATILWEIDDLGDGATPFTFTFPTPLQFKAPANTKACVEARTNRADVTTVNAVGFYGG